MVERAVYTLVAGIGFAYFTAARRRFDLFCVAFFSAMVYFLPAILGYGMVPYNDSGLLGPEAIAPATYVAYTIIVGGIIAGGMLYSARHPGGGSARPARAQKGCTGMVAAILSLAGFALAVATLKSRLLLPKAQLLALLNGFNPWIALWENAAIVAVVSGFLERSWKAVALGALLLLADMFIGFRTSMVMTVGAIALILLSREKPLRLVVRHFKLAVASPFLIFFFFLYKQVIALVKVGEWNLLGRALSTPDAYMLAFQNSEPFAIQGVFNRIIVKDYHVTGEHLAGVFAKLLFVASVFQHYRIPFNALYQPTLFPGVSYGMGSTIWGEMWAVGSWAALTGFVVLYVAIAYAGNRLLDASSPRYLGMLAHAFFLFVFYVHRNSLDFQVAIEEQAILCWLACYLISGFLQRLAAEPAPPQPSA